MLSQFFLKRRAKKLFFQALKLAKKQHSIFSSEKKQAIRLVFEGFQAKLVGSMTQKDLLEFKKFKESQLDFKGTQKWKYFIISTLGALAAALVIRQMWFELYKVPTGSMRPTIKELDHLTVSKLNFSLNVPFQPKHFYFDENLVKRSSIAVFTSENMDVADSDTRYFYLIPGKKLLVKRLLGKPGDVLYFYGGKIYGLDKKGRDITPELNLASTDKIDHIPFIYWQGEKDGASISKDGTLYHMNAPFAKLSWQNQKGGNFEFTIPENMRPSEASYGTDLSAPWGIKNYATARILTTQTKKKLYPYDASFSPRGLYLELKHHLNVNQSLLSTSKQGKFQLIPDLETSFIPLDEALARKLFANLYTARFTVSHGTLRRYGSNLAYNSPQLPKLMHIPDGTYEFYYGKAYEVKIGGFTKELPLTHPIYRFSNTALEVFFNLGIDFNTYFTPGMTDLVSPARYSYYRDGDLYVMGLPFLYKNDPALTLFESIETSRQHEDATYLPFLDEKAPYLADGSLDKQKLLTLGLRIPDKHYLLLGDNHAQSGDSRVFGFVPEENLKGCPDITFWPLSSRFGHLPQALGPVLNLPRACVWTVAFIITATYYRRKRMRENLPQTFTWLEG